MGAARLQEKMALRPCSARLDPSFGRAWARKHARLGPNLRNPERNSCPNADSAWAGLGLGLRSRIQVYFCRFYFVQDMTQIRAGAAIGLATLAFILIYKKRNLFGVCLFAISLFFHLSVVVLVPVVVAVYLGRDFISRYPIFIIIILSFFLNAYLDYFFIISGLYSHLRLVDYIGGAFETVELSLFSFYFIIKILLLGYLIFFQWSNLTRFWRLVVYIGVISSCFQLAFSQYDSLALRLAEVFALFDVQLFMAPLFIEKLGRHFRSLYLSFLIVLGAVFFISSLNIMNPYQMTELF